MKARGLNNLCYYTENDVSKNTFFTEHLWWLFLISGRAEASFADILQNTYF